MGLFLGWLFSFTFHLKELTFWVLKSDPSEFDAFVKMKGNDRSFIVYIPRSSQSGMGGDYLRYFFIAIRFL
jgi:hypothetical protein